MTFVVMGLPNMPKLQLTLRSVLYCYIALCTLGIQIGSKLRLDLKISTILRVVIYPRGWNVREIKLVLVIIETICVMNELENIPISFVRRFLHGCNPQNR